MSAPLDRARPFRVDPVPFQVLIERPVRDALDAHLRANPIEKPDGSTRRRTRVDALNEMIADYLKKKLDSAG